MASVASMISGSSCSADSSKAGTASGSAVAPVLTGSSSAVSSAAQDETAKEAMRSEAMDGGFSAESSHDQSSKSPGSLSS